MPAPFEPPRDPFQDPENSKVGKPMVPSRDQSLGQRFIRVVGIAHDDEIATYNGAAGTARCRLRDVRE